MNELKINGITVPLPKASTGSFTGVGMQSWLTEIRSMAAYWGGAHKSVEMVVDAVPHPKVLEVFAGMGGWTIKHRDQFSRHVMMDWDEECCKLLRETSSAEVLQGDSYSNIDLVLAGDRFDFICMDYNANTTRKTFSEHKERELMMKVINHRPQFLAVTDSGAKYYKLTKGRFAEFYGEKIDTREDYAFATARYYQRNFGYGAKHIMYDGVMMSLLMELDSPVTATEYLYYHQMPWLSAEYGGVNIIDFTPEQISELMGIPIISKIV